MTADEYGQVAKWAAEGRLQAMYAPNLFRDCQFIPYAPHCAEIPFSDYRRRPDAPTMPEEVWIPDYRAAIPLVRALYDTPDMCRKANHSATPVRYVRADVVIDGDRLEWLRCDGEWRPAESLQYRFKEAK